MAWPNFNGSNFGAAGGQFFRHMKISGNATYAMAGLDAGWCARHPAQSTKDVKAVKLVWNALTAAGTVEARIETIDTATGDPTGTLYDAAATKTFTPASAGSVQTVTFDTLPTAGRTVGTYYGLVLITTVAGTTQTLRSHIGLGGSGSVLLTTATAVTRSTFAPVNPSRPMAVLVMEDDTEEAFGLLPFTGTSTNVAIYGADIAAAVKFTLQQPQVFSGVGFLPVIVGTPAGDLRARVLDASNNVISGTTVTVDKDFILTSRDVEFPFAADVEFPAGTYRSVLDSAGSANSSNCYRCDGHNGFSAAVLGTNFMQSSTANMSTACDWSDQTSVLAPIWMLHSVDVAPSVRPEFRGSNL